jgi:hypothetical protein
VNATVIPSQSTWRYISGIDDTDPADYSSPSFDDSAWATGAAPFGNLDGDVQNVGQNAVAFNATFSPTIATTWPHATTGWIRSNVVIPPERSIQLLGWFDNGFKLYIGGVLVASGQGGSGYGGTNVTIPAGTFPSGA